ncbi:MAG: hypothetical protein FD129_332 [bacterium]|nr:MAG: hypothetical protein FD129_332 [bacterium]
MIVPGRSSSNALLWWHRGPAIPPVVEPVDPGRTLHVYDLARLGAPDPANGPRVLAVGGLAPDREYRLTIGSETVRSATLPAALNPSRPFRVALGSCFYHSKDEGISAVYDGRLHRAGPAIDLRFLCGDQLYMDLADGLGQALPTPWKAPDPWKKYGEQWPAARFPQLMAASPSVCLADDHEFWNDFPHEKAWIWWADKNPASAIRRQLDASYQAYQIALNLPPGPLADGVTDAVIDALLDGPARSFAIDVPPLSFFVLDLRSRRTVHDDPVLTELTPAAEMQRALAWMAGLAGPGILVLPQPIAIGRASTLERVLHAKGDWALSDYEASYGSLLDGLFGAPHDIMVLSGDIHWSRCYEMWRTDTGPRIFEVVSSPQKLMLGGQPPDPEKKNKLEGKLEWHSPSGQPMTAFWHNLMAQPALGPSHDDRR